MAYLRANAEMVARSAATLMWPAPRTSALQSLVQTSAFLADARVRVLDTQGQTLADSGQDMRSGGFVWVVPSSDVELTMGGQSDNAAGTPIPLGRPPIIGVFPTVHGRGQRWPPGSDITVIRRAQ